MMTNLATSSIQAISLEQIEFAYDQKIIFESLSLQFEKGKIHGLLGPNGAGKSTLIKLMSGLLKPSVGAVKLFGVESTDDMHIFGKTIGLLSDHAPLYPTLSVYDYLLFCAQIKKVQTPKVVITQLIEKLQLGHVQKNIIQTLSTGYRQRVALAQALVHNPAILILDEPTTGLDPESAGHLRELLIELRGEHTLIFSSHTLHEVQQICSNVTLVSSGKILFHGTKDDMLQLNKNISEKAYVLKANLPKIYSKYEVLQGTDITLLNYQALNESQVEILFRLNTSKGMNFFLKNMIEKEISVIELVEKKHDLEEIFLQLIQKKNEIHL